jgi:putative salt-induced outer membrane protein YdiY
VRKDGADYEVCRVSMGGVMKLRIALMLMVVLSGAPVAIRAQTPEPPPPLDLVTLKDGSQIYGDVIEMDNGELKIKIAFGVGNFITVKWDNVAKLSVNHPIPVHLKEGTVLMTTVQEGPDGQLSLKVSPMAGPLTVPIESVKAINPLIQPSVVYSGGLTAGLSQASGNSHLRSASLLGDMTGRSDLLRLTLLGRYIYGDDNGRVITRNSRGTIKLDFFVTKRFYWFAASYFEQDTFQDLKLRTSLSSGPGYQFIDKGDFASPYLKDMTLYFESGLAYFNEDFKIAPDKTSLRARTSFKWNWPILDEKVTFYHYDEFFPSIQNTNDFYMTSDQGVRFKLYEGLVSGFQLTYRYNNMPPPGIKSSDTLFLWTVGYSFDTSRKRT